MPVTLAGDETRPELIVALLFQCEHAHRQQYIVGSAEHPTPWDLSHAALNELLDLVVGL